VGRVERGAVPAIEPGFPHQPQLVAHQGGKIAADHRRELRIHEPHRVGDAEPTRLFPGRLEHAFLPRGHAPGQLVEKEPLHARRVGL